MKTTYKSNLMMALLTASALWMTAQHHDWLPWNAGFMVGVVAGMWALRIVEWQHDRWLAKRGYRRGHVRLDQGGK